MINRKRIRSDYLLLFCWLGVIFFASTGAGTAAHTLALLTRLIHAAVGPSVPASTLDTLDFCIRKTAHVTEYAILGILFYRAYRPLPITDWRLRTAGWAWLSATLYAATDEFHQSFVPGRTACVSDVCIDSCGAAIGLLLHRMVTVGRRLPTADANRSLSPAKDDGFGLGICRIIRTYVL